MKWFTIYWYQYLFGDQVNQKKPTIKMIMCRAKGHDNLIWHNPNGLEPDMRCSNCGEDLG